jgi:hypothetical protein
MKRASIAGLDFGDLIVGQLGEFLFPAAFRQPALVLAQETEQQIERAVRHVDDLRHATPERVVGFQISGFRWKVGVDRPRHAFVEEFRVRRGVEEVVEIRRLVENRESLSSRKAAARASTSAGTSAITARACSDRLRFVNSRNAGVWKIIGQNSGVPGRLFLTRWRVDVTPADVHCRSGSATSA